MVTEWLARRPRSRHFHVLTTHNSTLCGRYLSHTLVDRRRDVPHWMHLCKACAQRRRVS